MRPLTVLVCVGLIACSLVLIPSAQAGKVISARIDQLVEVSERIVLAKVESVQAGPDQKPQLAKAKVIEVWKGPKVETVEYLLTHRRYDCSHAVPGETVLLFLVKEEDNRRIAWAGYGRMTLETQQSKQYLASWDNTVIFPDGTPVTDFPGNERLRNYKKVEIEFVRKLVLGEK